MILAQKRNNGAGLARVPAELQQIYIAGKDPTREDRTANRAFTVTPKPAMLRAAAWH
jgi:hypothetical protein